MCRCSVRAYKAKDEIANGSNNVIGGFFTVLTKCVFELCCNEKRRRMRRTRKDCLTVQVDQLIEISKDAIEFHWTHAGKMFHRVSETAFHDLQTSQMRAFRMNQFIDCRLKFPFTCLIEHLEDIMTDEFTEIRKGVHIHFEITVTFADGLTRQFRRTATEDKRNDSNDALVIDTHF